MSVKLSGKKAAQAAAVEEQQKLSRSEVEQQSSEIWDDAESDAGPLPQEQWPPDAVAFQRINLLREFQEKSDGEMYFFHAGEQNAFIDSDGDCFVVIKTTNDQWLQFWLEAEEFEVVDADFVPATDESNAAESETEPAETGSEAVETETEPAETGSEAVETETKTASSEIPAAVTGRAPSPEEYYKRRRNEIEHELGQVSISMADLKAELKSTKKRYDELVGELVNLKPEAHPLLDREPEERSLLNQGDIALVEVREESDEPMETKSAEDDSWKQQPLEDLCLPAGVLSTLQNGDVTFCSIGELSAYIIEQTKAGAPDPLLTIPKIGRAKADKILAAFDEFWAKRNAG